MFDKIEWVSVEERLPCKYIIIDEHWPKDVKKYYVHIKGQPYPEIAWFWDATFIPTYGENISFCGEIDYWAEIPKWNH